MRWGERLSLTYMPGLSPSQIGLGIVYHRLVKEYERAPKGCLMVSMNKNKNVWSGGGILTLGDPWGQNVRFLHFLNLLMKYIKGRYVPWWGIKILTHQGLDLPSTKVKMTHHGTYT
jgi:hypothetical protein